MVIPLPIIFPMESHGKILRFSLTKKIKFYKLGIICGILHQEYLKMGVKKLNIFKDIKLEIFTAIETFFSVYKNVIFNSCPNVVLSGRIRHFKKIILKGRGFRGGSDQKIRRMWLGREIVMVGLPPLVQCTSALFHVN